MIGKLDVAIQQTAKAIAAGKSAEAHTAYAHMSQLRRGFQSVPPALREALAEVESDYTKIQQWQRWSDGNRRQQLCEELEVLPETGLHPDALATRVREIQTEWAKLDRLEARPERANEGIDRRFRALCHKAIEPAKPYFEKRDELRKQGSEETSQIIAEAKTAVAAENPDWRALTEMRKRTIEGLRALDRVNPRERKNLAAELKQVLGIIDERIKAQFAQIETAKATLIARAEALTEQSDTRTAMNQARDLQKLWQAAGNGKRSRDQAQWTIFRATIDTVFGRADTERAERTAQDRQAVEAAENLCVELEAIASANNALKTKLDRDKRRARFDVWTAHHDLLRKLETTQIDGEAFTAAQAQLAPITIAADGFQTRIDASVNGLESAAAESDDLRDCVLELEQLAGVEPPDLDRQRRMDLQVEKLAARMQGVHAPAPAAALEDLLTRWIELGPIDDADVELEARFKHAVTAMLDTLG